MYYFLIGHIVSKGKDSCVLLVVPDTGTSLYKTLKVCR